MIVSDCWASIDLRVVQSRSRNHAQLLGYGVPAGESLVEFSDMLRYELVNGSLALQQEVLFDEPGSKLNPTFTRIHLSILNFYCMSRGPATAPVRLLRLLEKWDSQCLAKDFFSSLTMTVELVKSKGAFQGSSQFLLFLEMRP